MGRNFESRFWCGFCQKTIEPTGKGGPAHSKRFDHIDDHFNGREGLPKADIRDWKHVDMETLESPGSSRSSPGRDGNSRALAAQVGAVGVVVGSNNPRKRGYGGEGEGGAARAKRVKDGRGGGNKDVFWLCVCSFSSTRPTQVQTFANTGITVQLRRILDAGNDETVPE
jgi:hypothetical protein